MLSRRVVGAAARYDGQALTREPRTTSCTTRRQAPTHLPGRC